jgi:hypothetical protein
MIIPQLPTSRIVEESGYPTSEEMQFRQNLLQALQQGASEEGLVAPTQSHANMLKIQNAKNTQGQYSCALGTLLYVITDPNDYTQDKVMIAVRNDNTYPNTPPLFKTVTLV